MQRYFENFPKIQYSNNSVLDITKRVTILNSVSSNPYAFYPYELEVHERPDQFSGRYYQDPFQSWLLYLSNKIVDPYYEWYLSDDEFNNFITELRKIRDIKLLDNKYYLTLFDKEIIHFTCNDNEHNGNDDSYFLWFLLLSSSLLSA